MLILQRSCSQCSLASSRGCVITFCMILSEHSRTFTPFASQVSSCAKSCSGFLRCHVSSAEPAFSFLVYQVCLCSTCVLLSIVHVHNVNSLGTLGRKMPHGCQIHRLSGTLSRSMWGLLKLASMKSYYRVS